MLCIQFGLTVGGHILIRCQAQSASHATRDLCLLPVDGSVNHHSFPYEIQRLVRSRPV